MGNTVFLKVKEDKKKKENTKFVQKGFGINVERIREKVVRI